MKTHRIRSIAGSLIEYVGIAVGVGGADYLFNQSTLIGDYAISSNYLVNVGAAFGIMAAGIALFVLGDAVHPGYEPHVVKGERTKTLEEMIPRA